MPAESFAPSSASSRLGPTLVLRGELAGREDLLIEGPFEGAINLEGCCLTVGAKGEVKAEIRAARVIIHGAVTGNISASEKIEIQKTGRVMGDLVGPAIAISDGAYFKGSIEILREESGASSSADSPPAAHAASA